MKPLVPSDFQLSCSTSATSAVFPPAFYTSKNLLAVGSVALAFGGNMISNHHQEKQPPDDSIQAVLYDYELTYNTSPVPKIIVTNVTTSSNIRTVMVNGSDIATQLRDKIPGGTFYVLPG